MKRYEYYVVCSHTDGFSSFVHSQTHEIKTIADVIELKNLIEDRGLKNVVIINWRELNDCT